MRHVSSIILILTLASVFAAQVQLRHDPIVIKNVTVIDMTDRKPQPGMTVTISDGRIASIGKGTKSKSAGAVVIDGTGKFLIPALWDMHVHIRDSDRMLPL